MFSFIHAADVHIDSPLWGLERYEGAPVDEIRGATRRSFENLVTLAIEEKVDFVIIAGDLYDGEWKDYNTALFFVREVAKLRDAGIRVFAVTGNHDAASQITRSLRMPDNVTLFSTRKPQTIRLDSLGVALHGQSFAQRMVTEDLSASYPDAVSGYFNIGILHTALTGREGHETYAPCRVDALLERNYDYWALGHVHKREILNENPWILFPGNTQGRHVRERGPKGCTLVSVSDDRSVTLEHRDLHVLEWALCEVEASGANSPEDIVERTRELIEQRVAECRSGLLAVRVTIDGSCRAHDALLAEPVRWINEIRSSITDASGGAVWIEKVQFRTRTQVALDEALNRSDALGDLLRFINSLDSTDEVLAPLKDELQAFRAKLPIEIFHGPDAVDPLKLENIKETLEETKQFLIPRLLTLGGKP
ncbi:MAG: putative metallophosphoesterase YhaO [Syntrophorhabdaceae bacterium PtaU1.Bin034]|nr:MAG: putative metallophosphoesterase YhaO [Syntrophorhabdaceae bacterium PtaU1.Bin034]